jgi:hypothetical protein
VTPLPRAAEHLRKLSPLSLDLQAPEPLYSNEGSSREALHVHVRSADAEAKLSKSPQNIGSENENGPKQRLPIPARVGHGGERPLTVADHASFDPSNPSGSTQCASMYCTAAASHEASATVTTTVMPSASAKIE